MRKIKTRIVGDGTIETDYNDSDIERTHTEPTPQNTESPVCPPAIMKAFKRAKRAGKKNDARSRKIAAALRAERDGIAKPSVKATKQSTLSF